MSAPSADPPVDLPLVRVVVCGVAGAGKTTVSERLAAALDARALDGDSLQPPENVAKMSSGVPLTDADRWPWLIAVRDRLAGSDRLVVACSALRRSYRDLLRETAGIRFVFLDIDPPLARRRLEERRGHFMGAGMVESQFRTLERPGEDETDLVRLDAGEPLEAVVAAAVRALAAGTPS